MVEIRSGNFRIIESGMAMTIDEDAGLEFKVDLDDASVQFNISVSFQEDAERNMIIKMNKDTVQIEFNGFGDPSAYGVRGPVEITLADGRVIFLRIWVTRMGANYSAKKVEYVFYEEIVE